MLVQKSQAVILARECTDEIFLEYSHELASCKRAGRCINKRYLKTLIENKKKKYKVSSEISPSTIQSRSRRGTVKSYGCCANPLLADAEEALVEI